MHVCLYFLRFMICCDTCEDWFHGDCVGISMSKGREMEKTGEEWCCRVCKGNFLHVYLSIRIITQLKSHNLTEKNSMICSASKSMKSPKLFFLCPQIEHLNRVV